MLDLAQTPDEYLEPIAEVVSAAVEQSETLRPDDVMVVGAWCRDIQHTSLGHRFPTTATRDLDLALALASWHAYERIATAFPRIGDNGIRFRIANVAVDLLPFGEIEDPQGVASPPTRSDGLSVWAFEEIFTASLPLALPGDDVIRIPSVAGFCAAKLGAWLDRSQWHETKDAADLALILCWYAESGGVQQRLYETHIGNEILLAYDTDLALAAAHLLGVDVAQTIGTSRTAELLERWPGPVDLMIRELTVRGAPSWTSDVRRRRALLDALTEGLQSTG